MKGLEEFVGRNVEVFGWDPFAHDVYVVVDAQNARFPGEESMHPAVLDLERINGTGGGLILQFRLANETCDDIVDAARFGDENVMGFLHVVNCLPPRLKQ